MLNDKFCYQVLWWLSFFPQAKSCDEWEGLENFQVETRTINGRKRNHLSVSLSMENVHYCINIFHKPSLVMSEKV